MGNISESISSKTVRAIDTVLQQTAISQTAGVPLMSHSEAAFNAEAEEEVLENVQPNTFKVPEALMLIQQNNVIALFPLQDQWSEKPQRTKYTFLLSTTAAQ